MKGNGDFFLWSRLASFPVNAGTGRVSLRGKPPSSSSRPNIVAAISWTAISCQLDPQARFLGRGGGKGDGRICGCFMLAILLRSPEISRGPLPKSNVSRWAHRAHGNPKHIISGLYNNGIEMIPQDLIVFPSTSSAQLDSNEDREP